MADDRRRRCKALVTKEEREPQCTAPLSDSTLRDPFFADDIRPALGWLDPRRKPWGVKREGKDPTKAYCYDADTLMRTARELARIKAVVGAIPRRRADFQAGTESPSATGLTDGSSTCTVSSDSESDTDYVPIAQSGIVPKGYLAQWTHAIPKNEFSLVKVDEVKFVRKVILPESVMIKERKRQRRGAVDSAFEVFIYDADTRRKAARAAKKRRERGLPALVPAYERCTEGSCTQNAEVPEGGVSAHPEEQGSATNVVDTVPKGKYIFECDF